MGDLVVAKGAKGNCVHPGPNAYGLFLSVHQNVTEHGIQHLPVIAVRKVLEDHKQTPPGPESVYDRQSVSGVRTKRRQRKALRCVLEQHDMHEGTTHGVHVAFFVPLESHFTRHVYRLGSRQVAELHCIVHKYEIMTSLQNVGSRSRHGLYG
jgi:hypothetical protein